MRLIKKGLDFKNPSLIMQLKHLLNSAKKGLKPFFYCSLFLITNLKPSP